MKRSVSIAVGCIVGLIALVVIVQVVSARAVDRTLSRTLTAVAASVPEAWVERDRSRGGGVGVFNFSSSQRTHTIVYNATVGVEDLERVLQSSGATNMRCESNPAVTQCSGAVKGHGVGLFVENDLVYLTVSEKA